jgi:hypothetical protein
VPTKNWVPSSPIQPASVLWGLGDVPAAIIRNCLSHAGFAAAKALVHVLYDGAAFLGRAGYKELLVRRRERHRGH